MLQTDIDMQHVSESVFKGLCGIIGTSQQVAMRREVVDLMEIVREDKNQAFEMMSGSRREGFRLPGSDIDNMYCLYKHRVIWSLGQVQNYNVNKVALILADCSKSLPGFTLLELLTPTDRKSVDSACICINDRRYISSSLYRKITCSHIFPNSTEHGPCSTGSYTENMEYDNAHCFGSDFWPPSASSWIKRCNIWPEGRVLKDIVRSGCHFVAIGHKLGIYEDKEWRISFSLAEQKLVYSMNHCQFLMYGLLKLFLKEVINNELSEDDKLLCSYHMKTAVFWVLQKNTMRNWCPQNLLQGFWFCFKFILKCVYEGSCPNFFIPENNMFLSKIHGEAGNTLFLRLYGLYEKGIACLLHCHSISPFIRMCNPRQHVCTDTNEDSLIFEKEFKAELDKCESLGTPDLSHCISSIKKLETLVFSNLTRNQNVMLQKYITVALQRTAFTLQNEPSYILNRNKVQYKTDKISSNMLKLVAKFGYVSDMLYMSMYYYGKFRYMDALNVLEKTKSKSNMCSQMCINMLLTENSDDTDETEKQLWNIKLKVAFLGDIVLDNNVFYVDELFLEQLSGFFDTYDRNKIFVPTFIMLHMLEFLCFTQVDPTRAQTALNDLQFIVHLDQIVPPSAGNGDISWQILGICQQLSGNHYGAISSFLQSIGQEPLSKIQIATLMRIRDSLRVLRPDLFR